MHRAVIKRKNRVLNHITTINSRKASDRTNMDMCSCYVFAFGALEFMIETLIRGWVQNSLKPHKKPSYRGKSRVDKVINVLGELAETNLKYNNGIEYSKICDLIEKLAGASNKAKFKASIDSYSGGSQALVAAIDRIATTRHNTAHGAFWPDELSPNLSELEQDFLHVYNSLIVALNDTLPRR